VNASIIGKVFNGNQTENTPLNISLSCDSLNKSKQSI